MVTQSKTQILVCPNHGPMSNRYANHYADTKKIGVVISVCPLCGLALEFVDMEEAYSNEEQNRRED